MLYTLGALEILSVTGPEFSRWGDTNQFFWHNLCQKMHKTEKKIGLGACPPHPLDPPMGSMYMGVLHYSNATDEPKTSTLRFSQHDDDLGLMLMTMTQEDAGVSAVQFNAAIFWELYETSRDKYTVRVSE